MGTAEVLACVRALSDHELLNGLSATVERHCAATADMLAHLAEVDARRLYLGQACSSMFVFCVERLHMSEPAAYRRIHAARTVRRFPALLPMVASGELHLSAIKLLTPFLTDGNQEALLADARGASKRNIEQMLARRFPGTPARDSIRRTRVRPVLAKTRPHASAPEAPCAAQGAGELPAEHVCPPGQGQTVDLFEPAPPPDRTVEREESYNISFTASRALRDKVLQARDLLRHAHPGGDLTAVFGRAIDLLLADLQRKRFGRRNPRAKARDRAESTGPEPAAAPGVAREPQAAAAQRASPGRARDRTESTGPEPTGPEPTPAPVGAREPKDAATQRTSPCQKGNRTEPNGPEPTAAPGVAREPKVAATQRPSPDQARNRTEPASPEPTAAPGVAREPKAAATERASQLASEPCSHDGANESAAAIPAASHLECEIATEAAGTTGADRGRGTPGPEASSGRPVRSRSRHVPNDVKRAVIERDGLRCAYVDEAGRRCTATGFLELHHRDPFANGGEHNVANVTVYCAAHNAYASELDFGVSGPRSQPDARD